MKGSFGLLGTQESGLFKRDPRKMSGINDTCGKKSKNVQEKKVRQNDNNIIKGEKEIWKVKLSLLQLVALRGLKFWQEHHKLFKEENDTTRDEILVIAIGCLITRVQNEYSDAERARVKNPILNI